MPLQQSRPPNVKRNLPFGWNWVSNVFSCLKEEENKALPNSSAGSGCRLQPGGGCRQGGGGYLPGQQAVGMPHTRAAWL